MDANHHQMSPRLDTARVCSEHADTSHPHRACHKQREGHKKSGLLIYGKHVLVLSSSCRSREGYRKTFFDASADGSAYRRRQKILRQVQKRARQGEETMMRADKAPLGVP